MNVKLEKLKEKLRLRGDKVRYDEYNPLTY